MKLKILFEDEYIIVCKKPAGVSSQTEHSLNPDMVSILINYLHKSGSARPYIGVIHRLDKPVSGIMVYAKTKEAAAALSKELAADSFTKKYYAIVQDSVNLKERAALEDYLMHDVKSNTSSVTSKNTPEAKLAKLNYHLINRATIDNIPLAVLDIELLTGRHHQIRVQLNNAGFPILNDLRYNKNMPADITFKIKKTGLALCAYSLSFKHPVTKELMTFTDKPADNIWKELI